MSVSPQRRSVRRLSASSLARRERRAAAKRRRKMLAAVAAFATVAIAPVSITAWMGQAPAFPHLDAAKSFLSMMTGRSPGDRTAAELMKTKKKAPHQRALAKIAKPENPPAFEEAIAPPPAPMLAELPPFAPVLAGLGPLLETPPPGGIGPPITTTGVPPGGGGGPPTETPPNPPETPPPPVVPEPGTWATMLLGFGLIGFVMRRRRRTEAAPSPA